MLCGSQEQGCTLYIYAGIWNLDWAKYKYNINIAQYDVIYIVVLNLCVHFDPIILTNISCDPTGANKINNRCKVYNLFLFLEAHIIP